MLGTNYVRLLWSLDASDDIIDVVKDYSVAWQDYWLEHENDFKHENIAIHFLTSVSFNGEIDRVVSEDIPVLGVAFIVMTLYLSLTLGKLHCIRCRVLAALASIVSTLCGLLMGLGVASVFDHDMNTLILLIPFLILGIGVDDDMYVQPFVLFFFPCSLCPGLV